MTLQEKEDTLFGEKNNKRHLMKLRIDYKDPQSYICQIGNDDPNYIQIPGNLPLVACCVKSKMVNPS